MFLPSVFAVRFCRLFAFGEIPFFTIHMHDIHTREMKEQHRMNGQTKTQLLIWFIRVSFVRDPILTVCKSC